MQLQNTKLYRLSKQYHTASRQGRPGQKTPTCATPETGLPPRGGGG